jgi:hypothetical protein
MTTIETLSTALLDVRKAYRLLADFQTSMLNLVNDIASGLDVEYLSASYRHSPPQRDSCPFGIHAGVDYLPMLDVSYIYLNREASEAGRTKGPWAGDYLVDFRLVSDSKILDEEEGRTACSPEQSRSLLVTYVFLACKPFADNASWYQEIWWNSDHYPTNDGHWKMDANMPLAVCRHSSELQNFFDASRPALVASEINGLLASGRHLVNA